MGYAGSFGSVDSAVVADRKAHAEFAVFFNVLSREWSATSGTDGDFSLSALLSKVIKGETVGAALNNNFWDENIAAHAVVSYDNFLPKLRGCSKL